MCEWLGARLLLSGQVHAGVLSAVKPRQLARLLLGEAAATMTHLNASPRSMASPG